MGLLWTIGDSYTDPTTYWLGMSNWAGLLAARLQLGLVNPSDGGAGYCNFGARHTIFGTQLGLGPCPAADVTIVFGSINDYLHGYTPAQVQDAAVETFRSITRQAPGTSLLVAGPQCWDPDGPTDGLVAIRDAVATAARMVGAQFVDALPWMQNVPQLLASDNAHPNAAGQAYIADLLEPYVAGMLACRAAPPAVRANSGGALIPAEFPLAFDTTPEPVAVPG